VQFASVRLSCGSVFTDDPQFVNYWGYKFILESDAHKYDKYYIRSVTVKKLKP